MRQRAAVTLVEVLVAIFVMGIGMIALLTLFPIGVLRMQQAINAELAAQSANNADKLALIYNLRNDGSALNPGAIAGVGNPDYLANPSPGTLKSADPNGESYAILVDPIGFGGAPSPWVGATPNVLLRRPVSYAKTPPEINSAFTLWDDMSFNNDLTLGLPGTPELAGTAVMRNSRFSWAYTLRRPATSDKSVVDCSIVVFNSRSLSLTTNLTLGEYVYPQAAYFNPTNNTVVVDYTSNVPPQIRPGGWIMDATVYQTTSNGVQVGGQHAYWYRVLSTQDVGANYTVFEVQGPIRGFNNFPFAPVADPTTGIASTAYQGTVVILDGVVEVFEKGPAHTP